MKTRTCDICGRDNHSALFEQWGRMLPIWVCRFGCLPPEQRKQIEPMTDLHLTIEELRLRRAIALVAMDIHSSSIEQWAGFLLEALRLNNLIEIGEACEQEFEQANKTA